MTGEPQVFAWRGRILGWMPTGDFRPWCGTCERPVDRMQRERTGTVLRMVAWCHGRSEVVDVPAREVAIGQKVFLGVAFEREGPHGRTWSEDISAAWQRDLRARRGQR